jgi:uncharacterized membrane protein YbhN (UPF0104 family)
MSAEQYARIKQKIRDSAASSSMSIWLAFALTAVGVAATLLIALLTTSMNPDIKGKLEVGGWASFSLVIVLVAVHITKHAQHQASVEDIINEIDTYSYHRASTVEKKP